MGELTKEVLDDWERRLLYRPSGCVPEHGWSVGVWKSDLPQLRTILGAARKFQELEDALTAACKEREKLKKQLMVTRRVLAALTLIMVPTEEKKKEPDGGQEEEG